MDFPDEDLLVEAALADLFNEFIRKSKYMYSLIHLLFETDPKLGIFYVFEKGFSASTSEE